MQKVINVLAVTSFVVSGAVVGSGIYVYFNRASILDGIKSKVMDSVTGKLPGALGSIVPDIMPDATGPVLPTPPSAPSAPF